VICEFSACARNIEALNHNVLGGFHVGSAASTHLDHTTLLTPKTKSRARRRSLSLYLRQKTTFGHTQHHYGFIFCGLDSHDPFVRVGRIATMDAHQCARADRFPGNVRGSLQIVPGPYVKHFIEISFVPCRLFTGSKRFLGLWSAPATAHSAS